MALKVRDLDSLAPGDRFLTIDTQRTGTLVATSSLGATVEWDKTKQKREGTTRWGETFTFETPEKRQVISNRTQVAKLVRRRTP